MNDTESRAAAPLAAPPRRLPADLVRRRRPVLFVPLVGLAFETATLLAARTRAPDLSAWTYAGFWLYWALPYALCVLLMAYAARRTTPGWRICVGLAVALGLSGVAGYVQARLSPDASLIGLSGPLVQVGVVGVVGLVVGSLAAVAGRSDAGRRHSR